MQISALIRESAFCLDDTGVIFIHTNRSGQYLHEFMWPINDAFRPAPEFLESIRRTFVPHSTASSVLPPRYPTPPPASGSQTPSHRQTVANFNDFSSLGSDPYPSTSRLDADSPRHWILDHRLTDKPLQVIVTGGEYSAKHITVVPTAVDGRVVVRWKHYRSWKNVKPGWISVKHPAANRDNGLLVVIAGIHTGSYVRRYDHFYKDSKDFIWAMKITHNENDVDTMSGEPIILDTDDLCLSYDTSPHKKANDHLLSDLRREHLKKRRR